MHNNLSQDDDPHTDDRVSTVTRPHIGKSVIDSLKKLFISPEIQSGDIYMKESREMCRQLEIKHGLPPEAENLFSLKFRPQSERFI
jgi:hypothetical protein